MRIVTTTIFFTITIFGIVSPGLQAGYLGSLGAKWQISSFRPLVEEPTPNLYGYGLAAAGGYSFNQLLDVTLFATYIPSQLKTAALVSERSQIIHYGCEVGFRFAETIYVGLRGLATRYRLLFQSNEDEVEGAWRGRGSGLVIGAYYVERREHFYQFSVDISSSRLDRKDEAASASRVFDSFALNFSYSFNSYSNFRLTPLFNSGFFKSLNL